MAAIERAIPQSGFTHLSVTAWDAVAVASLPLHHRDPFDRMLVAQARGGDMEIVTADPHFDAYDVRIFPAV